MINREFVVADSEKMKWENLEQFPKGVMVKILMRDKDTGAMALLAKTNEKMKRAKHKHPSDCHTLVLKGKMLDEKVGLIKKGMYCFFPANAEHGPEEIDAGTVLLLFANGPI